MQNYLKPIFSMGLLFLSVMSVADNTDKLSSVIKLLADGKELPSIYKDHQLRGNWVGCRECHIEPNWLLIYEYDNGNLILYLTRTGTHSDLFDK